MTLPPTASGTLRRPSLPPRPLYRGRSSPRGISDCHLIVQLNRFIPDFLTGSVAVSSKVIIGYRPIATAAISAALYRPSCSVPAAPPMTVSPA
jgi:hypothetical protein